MWDFAIYQYDEFCIAFFLFSFFLCSKIIAKKKYTSVNIIRAYEQLGDSKGDWYFYPLRLAEIWLYVIHSG